MEYVSPVKLVSQVEYISQIKYLSRNVTKINDEFEVWMGEGSGWVMDEISTISLNIARMKY